MSREKYKKNELESDYKQDIQKVEDSLPPLEKLKMSFDLYFQKLMVKNKRVYPHHKAPMRQYAESNGAVDGTEEEFDKIFRNY